MKKELWVIWRDSFAHQRYKIAFLIKENDNYIFKYNKDELKEAQEVGFKYFPGFDDLTEIYKSPSLFPNIATRLPNKTRPDYLEILNYYNLEKESDDFTILTATRGRNITDNYEFVPAFEASKIEFDVAGTNHCRDVQKCQNYLKINQSLYLEPEPENLNDPYAIKIIFKENNKSYHLGYVPRCYSKDLSLELKKSTKYSAMIKSLNLESTLSDEKITVSVKLIFNV